MVFQEIIDNNRVHATRPNGWSKASEIKLLREAYRSMQTEGRIIWATLRRQMGEQTYSERMLQ